MLCLHRDTNQDDAGVTTGEQDNWILVKNHIGGVVDEQETWVLVNKGDGGATSEQDDWVLVNEDMVGPSINAPIPAPCGGGS